MVAEVRQFGKVVLVRVFDDEQTSRTQQSTGEDFGRDVSEAGEIVGRIGKYDVVGSGRSVDEAHRIAAYDGYIVLILINGIFSIWSGYWIYKHQRKWGELFIFPILYLITAYFFMPRYTYYFALAYLALAYLSWAMRQQK